MKAFTIPGIVKNTLNLREHWSTKSKRAAAERHKAMTLCPRWEDGPLLSITLTRYGTRSMDSDGLAASCKFTRDGIAARLGVDDGSSLIRWDYAQATCPKGKERVEVTITALPQAGAVRYVPRETLP